MDVCFCFLESCCYNCNVLITLTIKIINDEVYNISVNNVITSKKLKLWVRS